MQKVKTAIANIVIKTLGVKAKAFEEATKEPVKAQKKALFEYLSRNKDTEFGLKYNFPDIKSVDEYRGTVPMGDAESFRPYMERMAKGESNILTKDKVIFFAATSGTTNKMKLIPMTKYSQDKKTEVTSLWSYYVAREHPGVLKGKVLAIISSEIEGHTESGLVYGAESGNAYKALPKALKDFYAVPYEVFEIEDHPSRYYAILRIAMEKNVTMVTTLAGSAIVILCEELQRSKEKIIEDIEKGVLHGDLLIAENTRKALEKNLKPNPARAAELKAILKEKDALLPKDFWPNLELVACWKSGTVKLYIKELARYFGDVPVRDMGYVSSEARSSFPVSDKDIGGVLAINTNFYEFLPREEANKKEKRTLLADELEVGKEYFIIVTTPGGLYRYDIDDVIKVNGFFNKTPVIEFVQKGLNAVSVTGEKLYESHVNEAVNKAIEKHKLLLTFFSASIEWGNPPRYIFLAEFDGPYERAEKKSFLQSVEKELYLQNREYEVSRKKNLLAHPVLKVVKKGGFEKYRAGRLAEGAHDSQFKVPEITADFTFQKNFEIEEEIS